MHDDDGLKVMGIGAQALSTAIPITTKTLKDETMKKHPRINTSPSPLSDTPVLGLQDGSSSSTKISNWPALDRPREKLLALGASELTDAELLAVLLRTGIPGLTAVDLGRQLLKHFGGLQPLLSADYAEFSKIKGLGKAKYAQVHACFELSRRAQFETICQGEALSSPSATREYLRVTLSHLHHEVFWCLFLDNQHRIVASQSLAHGTIDTASIYPREVVKICLRFNAAAVIFAHNHPSGIAEPSQADQQMTTRLRDSLALIDIRLLDHFVVAGNQVTSMAERGMI